MENEIAQTLLSLKRGREEDTQTFAPVQTAEELATAKEIHKLIYNDISQWRSVRLVAVDSTEEIAKRYSALPKDRRIYLNFGSEAPLDKVYTLSVVRERVTGKPFRALISDDSDDCRICSPFIAVGVVGEQKQKSGYTLYSFIPYATGTVQQKLAKLKSVDQDVTDKMQTLQTEAERCESVCIRNITGKVPDLPERNPKLYLAVMIATKRMYLLYLTFNRQRLLDTYLLEHPDIGLQHREALVKKWIDKTRVTRGDLSVAKQEHVRLCAAIEKLAGSHDP